MFPTTAAQLTKGIKGAETMAEVAQHIGTTATDTLSASDDTPNMLVNLKRIAGAVDDNQMSSGVKARMSMQSAMVATGALLGGPTGFSLADLGGRLHTIANDPKQLREFAGEVVNLSQAKPGEHLSTDKFNSLATQINANTMQEAKTNNPVALFLGGAFLRTEQDKGILLESARQSAPHPAFEVDEGMHGGFLLHG